MKKNDLLLLGGVLLLALICLGGYHLLHRDTGELVEITIDDTIYRTIPLQTDITFDIPSQGKHTNRLEIKDGYANIIDADCPDKLCVHQKKINKNGETLVCLPHKVIVTIHSDDNTALDGIAQ